MKKITLVFMALLLSCYMMAQQVIITGTVTDIATDAPLIGANVLVKGTTIGTIADVDGRFSIDVPIGKKVIVFSSIGYQTQEILLQPGQTQLKITMKEDFELLDEVVVVGYGVQKKATLTGSVSSVGGAKIANSAASNLTNALAGQLPGLIVNTRSGDPTGDNATIYVRGKSTTGDSSPLWIIDGVAGRGDIARLNADDIESITVLKDASAAIYGSRGANGVILVTTKRGVTGKPQISYNGNVSFSQPTRLVEMSNAPEFMTWYDEVSKTLGTPQTYQEIIPKYANGTNDSRIGEANTDWMRTIAKEWTTNQTHDISIRGGSERVQYFFSGGFKNTDFVYRNNNASYHHTYNVRSNIDAEVANGLKVSLDISSNLVDYSKPNIDPWGETYSAHPNYPGYYDNGLPTTGWGTWGCNPALIAEGKTGYWDQRALSNNLKFSAEYKIPYVNGLSVSGYFAYDSYNSTTKNLQNQWTAYQYNPQTNNYDDYSKKVGAWGAAYIQLMQQNNVNWRSTAHFRINYARTFGAHDISAFVAYEQMEYRYDWFKAQRRDFATDDLEILNAGTGSQTVGGNAEEDAMQNFFGRLNYSYKGKYLAELTLRFDGSPKFPEGNRFGVFPGLSLGWRISEESFIKDRFDFVDNLKLRASIGKLGNDKVSSFQYQAVYNMSQTNWFFGEKADVTNVLKEGTVPNRLITWEEVVNKNIGIDVTLLKKLNFSVEFYHAMRSNILTTRNATVPDYSAITLPAENIGKVKNYGWEFNLAYNGKIDQVSYNIGGNLTTYKNKIVDIDEPVNTPEWRKKTGKSIDAQEYLLADGLLTQADIDDSNVPKLMNAKVGDIKYIDYDKSGSITDNDKVRLGKTSVPQLVYGVNLGLEWKNLSFSALFQGQGQAQAIYRVRYGYNIPKEFYDNRWTESNPNAKYPRPSARGDSFNDKDSQFWLKDIWFVRLKNISLSYTVPQNLLANSFVKGVRVSLTGENLFTIDEVGFCDPEGGEQHGRFYPQQRVIGVGLNINL